MTSKYLAIYTDGSNDGDRLALAAVFRQQVYSLRLPSAISIFIAEANVIFLALKFVASSDESKFMFCPIILLLTNLYNLLKKRVLLSNC
jgi:hypothetical protein